MSDEVGRAARPAPISHQWRIVDEDVMHWFGPAVLLGLLTLAGCKKAAPPSPERRPRRATRTPRPAALSPEDQKLADAQKVCPVTGERSARWARRSR